MSRSFADAIKGTNRIKVEEPPSLGKDEGRFAWNVDARPRVFPVKKGKSTVTKAAAPKETRPKTQIPDERKASKKRKPTVASVNFADILASRSPANKKKVPAKKKKKVPAFNKNKASEPEKHVIEMSDFPALGSGNREAMPRRADALVPKLLVKNKPKPPPKTRAAPPPNSSKQAKQKAPAVAVSSVPDSRMEAFFAFKKPLDGRGGVETDGAHDLLRLMKDGNGVVKKGRQRIRPRKKHFSSIKKKVLEERLRRWREANPEKETDKSATADGNLTSTVALVGFASADELEDDDEYEEMVLNLTEMATKIGQVKSVHFCRPSDQDPLFSAAIPAFVQFSTILEAKAAMGAWDGMVLGGESMSAQTIRADSECPDTGEAWEAWCVKRFAVAKRFAKENTYGKSTKTVVYVSNAITADDIEDEECLEECLADVRKMLEKFGDVTNLVLEREPTIRVAATYNADRENADKICLEISQQVLGGQLLAAGTASHASTTQVLLKNILNEEDVEDEDCLAESLDDIRDIISRFGDVLDVKLHNESLTVEVEMPSQQASQAISGLNGMVVGGSPVQASFADQGLAGIQLSESIVPYPEVPAKPEPMYSGDKRIPERFAECKRVPKVAAAEQRVYASFFDDDSIKPLLIDMLSELMRLQKRAVEEKNTKVKRRLVMGLREVARGIRSHKVKMIVMANNLDDYGVIDDKLQEILNLAHEEGLPVFFEFSKRTLGKAIGKSIKIGVIAVQNAEGAHQQFKKLVNLAAKTPTRSSKP